MVHFRSNSHIFSIIMMINKIHSNVQSMLAEAREIVSKEFYSRKNSSSRHTDRGKPSHLLRFRKKERIMMDGFRKRAYTHLLTESDNPTMASLRTATEPNARTKNNSLRNSLLAEQTKNLMPNESQLLSTKVYGFQKRPKQGMLKLQQKSSILVKPHLPQLKDKKMRYYLNATNVPEQPPMLIKTIENWEDQFMRKNDRSRRHRIASNNTVAATIEATPTNIRKITIKQELQLEPWILNGPQTDQF